MTDKGTSGQSVQKSPELSEGLFLMDGIKGLRSLPRHSVDMLLTDPPYGTNLFNHQTNVKLTSHIVCIVLKGLGENLRKIAMHVTNDFITSAVNVNFHSGVSTWCYFDEFHILLRDALTASYFVAVWKMLRKKGCVPSALTQNVKDLLASREIEAILDNTDFMILLSQAQSDRAILAKQLGISEHQLSYITHSNSGEGLLFYGDVTIPFVDRFPRGEIYNLLTTRPEDLKNEAKTE